MLARFFWTSLFFLMPAVKEIPSTRHFVEVCMNMNMLPVVLFRVFSDLGRQAKTYANGNAKFVCHRRRPVQQPWTQTTVSKGDIDSRLDSSNYPHRRLNCWP
jgi:hypothetical protein